MLTIPQGDYRGFIFDVDGTLAHSMPHHFIAWTGAFRENGAPFEFDEETFYNLGGTTSHEIVIKMNQRYGSSLDPDAVIASKHRIYLERLPQIKPIREVVDLAQSFRSQGFPIAFASGGTLSVVEQTLAHLSILDWFSIRITPKDVSRGKPAPDMFLLAAQQMAVPPSQCLVFEDSPLGKQAADAAGMGCVLVPRPEGF